MSVNRWFRLSKIDQNGVQLYGIAFLKFFTRSKGGLDGILVTKEMFTLVLILLLEIMILLLEITIFFLPKEILDHLDMIGLTTLDQINRPKWSILKGGYWFNPRDVGLTSEWALRWDNYINVLKE